MTPEEGLAAIRKSDMSDGAVMAILQAVWSEAFGEGETCGYTYATGGD